jgi:hypothetical protein
MGKFINKKAYKPIGGEDAEINRMYFTMEIELRHELLH